jgi:CRP-like cAMP-binding protein
VSDRPDRTNDASAVRQAEAGPSGGVREGAAGDALTDERNRLLRALPAEEYERLLPHLEPFELQPMQILAAAGEPIRHAYFPQKGIVSVLRVMRDGTMIEVGTIGNEGMAGLSGLIDEDPTPSVIAGQVPGGSKRLPLATLRDALPQLPRLGDLLRRYALSFLDQVSQTLACNSIHPIQQRCARWLLMTHDRVGSDEFVLTHEVLAQMLAVRRAGVTEAAGELQRARLISYSRGRVTIRDRAGLEAAACECYRVVRDDFDRLLGDRIPGPS